MQCSQKNFLMPRHCHGQPRWEPQFHPPLFSPLLLPSATTALLPSAPLGSTQSTPEFFFGELFSCQLIFWMLSHGAFSQRKNNARLLLGELGWNSGGLLDKCCFFFSFTSTVAALAFGTGSCCVQVGCWAGFSFRREESTGQGLLWNP